MEQTQDDELVPLRKKFRRKETGKEDNFVQSYYKIPDANNKLNDAQIDQLRWNAGIAVDGESCPAPISDFAQLNLPSQLQVYLQNKDYKHPSSIQMQALPCVMSGRDIIGIAETGSGKSLCYILPLCHLLLSRRHRSIATTRNIPMALILVPTRELVQQSYETLTEILKYMNIDDTKVPSSLPDPSHPMQAPTYRATMVCGGMPISQQIQQLNAGVDVVIATPGRLIDLIDKGKINLTRSYFDIICFQLGYEIRIIYLVLDEADRMLGMGMEEQLRKIVGVATQTLLARQTLLWSATMPTALDRLARSAVLNAITITVGVTGITNRKIHHNVQVINYAEKPIRLLKVLRHTTCPPVIVFANTIDTVDEVTLALKKEQFHVASLHSEKTQAYRFRVMTALKSGGVDVLVATDLASRGLDIPEVSHVISYDMPETIEDYIHRCGRTARFNRYGQATAFVTLDCKVVEDLKDVLVAAKQEIPDELVDSARFGKKIIRTEFGDRVI
ncbi:ATP-dependent RNA helicase abstrakt [Trichoplax sp. H2]|nr:ATP-dependent RNA helicase abstrakt [Trichoplax sp. H2]|eukprot:RDD43158.1 ATP-dependent RNA helicase abstrakt [Trichoplax sp. H2]